MIRPELARMFGLLGPPQAMGGLLDPNLPKGDPLPNIARLPKPGPVTMSAVPVPGGAPGVVKPTPLSILERLKMGAGDVVSGGYDPRVSPQENEAAQRMAAIRAGLAMMAASGSRVGQGANLGEVLLTGLSEGQATGAQARERAYLRTQEERLEQALTNPEVIGTLTPKQKAMIQLLPPGKAAELLASLAFAPAEKVDPLVLAEGSVAVDPFTGKPIATNPKAVQPEKPNWTGEQKIIARSLGIEDLDALTPEQGKEFLGALVALKKAGATQVNVAGREAQQEFGNVGDIARRFNSEVGEAKSVADAYGRVLASVQDPSTAGDISLIFAYMKMLDPTSAVREGEQATAQNAGSIPGTIVAKYNQLIRGQGRLDGKLRADYVDRAGRLARQKQKQIAPVLRRYTEQAGIVGLDPRMFIYDPFAELGVTPPAPPAPAGRFNDLVPKR
jgi:hypothetical protein